MSYQMKLAKIDDPNRIMGLDEELRALGWDVEDAIGMAAAIAAEERQSPMERGRRHRRIR